MEIWKFYFDNFDDAYAYFCKQIDWYFDVLDFADMDAYEIKAAMNERPELVRESPYRFKVTSFVDTSCWTLEDLYNENNCAGLIELEDHKGRRFGRSQI